MVAWPIRRIGEGIHGQPGWPRRVRRTLRGVSAGAVCAAMLGCSQPDPNALLARGERLILDAKWHEAMQPLKQCLLIQPDNPGAHFYLGRAYLNARFGATIPPWRLTVALGELETALRTFERHGRVQPLDRYTPQQFEVMCHVTKAQAHLRKIEFGMGTGIPPSAMAAVMRDMEQDAEAARAIMPESEDVKVLESFIAQFKRAGVVPPLPPSLAAPPDPEPGTGVI